MARSASTIDYPEVIPHARARIIEVIGVLDIAADHHTDDAVYGVLHLVEWLDGQFEEHESDKTPWTGSQLSNLLAQTATAVAVLNEVNNRLDCQILHACNTILNVAMDSLNEADSCSVSLRKAVLGSQQ